MNHEETKNSPQRIRKIKSFINKDNWKLINFQSQKDDWEKIDRSNATIALNVLHAKNENWF